MSDQMPASEARRRWAVEKVLQANAGTGMPAFLLIEQAAILAEFAETGGPREDESS